MALSDLVFPTATVEVGNGQSLTVNAICFDDLVWLIQKDQAGIEGLVARIAGGETPEAVAAENLVELMQSFPKLAAGVIAVACGEVTDGALENARRLPLPVQIVALQEIARLTFEPFGGVKKFAAQTLGALATEGIALPQISALFSIGSTGSDKPQTT